MAQVLCYVTYVVYLRSMYYARNGRDNSEKFSKGIKRKTRTLLRCSAEKQQKLSKADHNLYDLQEWSAKISVTPASYSWEAFSIHLFACNDKNEAEIHGLRLMHAC